MKLGIGEPAVQVAMALGFIAPLIHIDVGIGVEKNGLTRPRVGRLGSGASRYCAHLTTAAHRGGSRTAKFPGVKRGPGFS